MTAPAPLQPTIDSLTPAQVRAVKLLGYPRWTDPSMLTGVRVATLRVLTRLRLVVHRPELRGLHGVRWLCSWRLTQRGLRVKRAIVATILARVDHTHPAIAGNP